MLTIAMRTLPAPTSMADTIVCAKRVILEMAKIVQTLMSVQMVLMTATAMQHVLILQDPGIAAVNLVTQVMAPTVPT